jgi:hypothetical protein
MKVNLKVIFFVSFIILFVFIFFVALNNNLSEKQAFVMLFGNYDYIHKTATWKDMKYPDKDITDSFFWRRKIGIVSSILFQPYKESGKNKFFF